MILITGKSISTGIGITALVALILYSAIACIRR